MTMREGRGESFSDATIFSSPTTNALASMIPTFFRHFEPELFLPRERGGGPPKAISFSRFAAHFEVSRQRKKSAPSLLRWHGGREGDGKRRISFNYEAFWREESVWQRCQSSLDEIEAQERRECCRKDVNSLSKSFFSIERRRRRTRSMRQ